MASGKKGKKTKGKTFALTDFLQDATGSLPSQPIRKSTTSWAEEVDDYESVSGSVNVVLPTAPKASRDYEDIASKVPKDPPYLAYLTNLPYDLEEEEIQNFFKNMKIVKMTIPKNDRSGDSSKVKGYGYVEFEDRESLMSALIIPDTTLKSRRIRIEIATQENDKRRGGRMGNDRMGTTDTTGDWRSTNRPDPPVERNKGFSRDNMREGGRDYGGFNRDRDFGRDRDSAITRNRDHEDRGGSWRGDRINKFERDDNRDDRRSGFRRFEERDERNGFNRGSSSRSDRDDRDKDSENSSEPRQRRKLQLAPRSKPLEQAAPPVSEKPASSASIFGSAKPVDTTERDRQIEEKLRQQEDRLRDASKDRKDRSGGENTEKRTFERGRPLVRKEDGEREAQTEDAQSQDRTSAEDNRRATSRNEYRSPDNKRKIEKPERPKREEKKDKPEKDMPKIQEAEPPNFQGSNKFALLPDDDGF